jgi:hypothetical protein
MTVLSASGCLSARMQPTQVHGDSARKQNSTPSITVLVCYQRAARVADHWLVLLPHTLKM